MTFRFKPEHPREQVLRRAQVEFHKFVEQLVEKYQLTTREELAILLSNTNSPLNVLLLTEREGTNGEPE